MSEFDITKIEALVRTVRSGERLEVLAATTEFVKHCKKPLTAYCARRMPRKHVEVLVWTVLGDALRKIDKEPTEPAATVKWLQVSAANAIKDFYRAVGRRREVLHDDVERECRTSMGVDGAPTPDDAVLNRIALVGAASQSLTLFHQQVLACYLDGLSASATAHSLRTKPRRVTTARSEMGLSGSRKGLLWQSLTALVIARNTPCQQLVRELKNYPGTEADTPDWRDEFVITSPALRDQVLAHAKTCEVCGDVRDRAFKFAWVIAGLLVPSAGAAAVTEARVVKVAAVAALLVGALCLLHRDQPITPAAAVHLAPAATSTTAPSTRTTTPPPPATTTTKPPTTQPATRAAAAETTTTTAKRTTARTSPPVPVSGGRTAVSSPPVPRPATRLILTLGADSYGQMKVVIGGVAAGKCIPVEGTPTTCSYSPPHGAEIQLDPVDLVSTWGPGPCAGRTPEQTCTFIASDDVEMTVDVFRTP